jgi:X-X-X-Leu-X-X-Gly heptad repeat protein
VKLDAALPEMGAGASKLDAGLGTLKSGLDSFRSLGIVKLEDGVADQINEVRKGLAEKDAVEKLVSDYTTFTGDKADGGKVEFLFQTDSISAPDTKTTVAADNSANTSKTSSHNENIFERIGDFFKNLFGRA